MDARFKALPHDATALSSRERTRPTDIMRLGESFRFVGFSKFLVGARQSETYGGQFAPRYFRRRGVPSPRVTG